MTEEDLMVLTEITAEELMKKYSKGDSNTIQNISSEIKDLISYLSEEINHQKILMELSRQGYLKKNKGYVEFL